jgi:hypothetical protein
VNLVDHPRGQAGERRIGESTRGDLMFNGYEKQVAIFIRGWI